MLTSATFGPSLTPPSTLSCQESEASLGFLHSQPQRCFFNFKMLEAILEKRNLFYVFQTHGPFLVSNFNSDCQVYYGIAYIMMHYYHGGSVR